MAVASMIASLFSAAASLFSMMASLFSAAASMSDNVFDTDKKVLQALLPCPSSSGQAASIIADDDNVDPDAEPLQERRVHLQMQVDIKDQEVKGGDEAARAMYLNILLMGGRNLKNFDALEGPDARRAGIEHFVEQNKHGMKGFNVGPGWGTKLLDLLNHKDIGIDDLKTSSIIAVSGFTLKELDMNVQTVRHTLRKCFDKSLDEKFLGTTDSNFKSLTSCTRSELQECKSVLDQNRDDEDTPTIDADSSVLSLRQPPLPDEAFNDNEQVASNDAAWTPPAVLPRSVDPAPQTQNVQSIMTWRLLGTYNVYVQEILAQRSASEDSAFTWGLGH